MAATAGYANETNDVIISYAQETTWGTKPGGTYTAIRSTGESLSGQKQRQRPAEINAGGYAAAAVTTQESASGSINVALSYGTYDDFLAALLGADWGAAVSITGAAGDISAVATGNKLTSTTAGKFTAIAAGQWIKLAGFSGAGNNGWARVAAKNSAQDLSLSGITLADETPGGAAVTVKGTTLKNSNLFKSFTVQKKLGTGQFLQYPGSVITRGTLGVSVGQFVSGSFDLTSAQEVKSTTDAASSTTPAPTGTVHDSIAGIKLWIDDAVPTAIISAVSLNIAWDGVNAIYGLGSAAAQGMVGGLLTVSGSLTTYFKDFTLYDRFKAETGTRLAWRTVDGAGAGYVISLPNSALMNPKVVAGGPNGAVMATFDVEGNPDSAGAVIQIDRAS